MASYSSVLQTPSDEDVATVPIVSVPYGTLTTVAVIFNLRYVFLFNEALVQDFKKMVTELGFQYFPLVLLVRHVELDVRRG